MTNKLKEMIMKISMEAGCDFDGDTIKIFDKVYFVDYLNYVVEEVK